MLRRLVATGAGFGAGLATTFGAGLTTLAGAGATGVSEVSIRD